jgi:hypothetical protein
MSNKPTTRDHSTTVDRKLALRKTTLRNLSEDDLGQVVGGGNARKSRWANGLRTTW